MNTFFEILSPSYLLFPALLGTAIMGLVCPLIGCYLVLRRTVFLGLTLPEIAAAGVSFTFWLQQTGVLPQLAQGEREITMIGSLAFTLLGMGLLGYLEQRGKGPAEGRLATAYALAGACSILFLVFNPAGQIEVLALLKGEVIALSTGELKILAAVFGVVLLTMVLFRREFLLTSFDRDLAFLLKGRQIIWDVLLYLLAGISIAFGVILAGPLLLFGFLVLPALAARALASGMKAFVLLASAFGVLMAVFGFYFSVRLDLPLGPVDVTLGCCLIFLAYALRRLFPGSALVLLLLCCVSVTASGCATPTGAVTVPEARADHYELVWLAKVKNSTGLPLQLPATSPLRSLAEMAGKASAKDRPSVMDLMRDQLRTGLVQKGFQVSFPENVDRRFPAASVDSDTAVRWAQEKKLSGAIFVSEIWRWEAEPQKFVRAMVDFKLIRIENGTTVWQRRVRGAVPTPSAIYLGQAYSDATKRIVGDLFGEDRNPYPVKE